MTDKNHYSFNLKNINTIPVDIKNENNELTITLDLPGVVKEDIDIRIDNDILSIYAKRQSCDRNEQDNYIQLERTRTDFSQKVRLPYLIDIKQSSANLENGILTLILPKSKEVRENRIPIK
jgi:HSP20 family protein